MNIYYNPETKKVYLVPNHYSHTISHINKTLEYAKKIGLTVPKEDEITVEVLAGDRHKGMLSVEFKTETFPNLSDNEYTDLVKYPHMMDSLKY